MELEKSHTDENRGVSRDELIARVTEARKQVVAFEKMLNEGDKQYNQATLSDAEKVARTRAQAGILSDIAELQTKISAMETELDEMPFVAPEIRNSPWNDPIYRDGDGKSVN